jgi:hypothetical protein
MCTCTRYSLVLAFVWRCRPFLSLERGREIDRRQILLLEKQTGRREMSHESPRPIIAPLSSPVSSVRRVMVRVDTALVELQNAQTEWGQESRERESLARPARLT